MNVFIFFLFVLLCPFCHGASSWNITVELRAFNFQTADQQYNCQCQKSRHVDMQLKAGDTLISNTNAAVFTVDNSCGVTTTDGQREVYTILPSPPKSPLSFTVEEHCEQQVISATSKFDHDLPIEFTRGDRSVVVHGGTNDTDWVIVKTVMKCATNFIGPRCDVPCPPHQYVGNADYRFRCNGDVAYCETDFLPLNNCSIFCRSTSRYECNPDGSRYCSDNFYGSDCDTFCVESAHGSCDDSGQKACVEGWYGKDCTLESHSKTYEIGFIVALVLFIVATIALVGLLVFTWCVRGRRSPMPRPTPVLPDVRFKNNDVIMTPEGRSDSLGSQRRSDSQDSGIANIGAVYMDDMSENYDSIPSPSDCDGGRFPPDPVAEPGNFYERPRSSVLETDV